MINTLVKKQIKGFLHGYTYDRKTGKKKAPIKLFGLVLLVLFCFLSLAICFVGISASLGDALLKTEDTVWMYFSIFSIIGIILGGLLDSLSSYAMLYLAKDNEMLLSMPIKSSTIVTSRMINVYIFALANLLYVMVPASIMYWVKIGFNFKTIIYPVILFFILGLVVTVVTSLFGYVIAFLHNHIKSKIVTTLIGTSLLLIFYYFMNFKFNNALDDLNNYATEIGNYIKDNLFFTYHLGMAHTGNILSLLIVFVISSILTFLVCMFIAKSFTKIAISKKGEKKKEFKEKDIKATSIEKTLFKKELKHFTNSVPYMMNCGLGLIFLIVGGVLALIKKDWIQNIYEMLCSVGNGYEALFQMLIVVITIAVSSLAVISAPSISLEGKNLWILKSLPINPITIFRSKSNLHFYLNLIPSLFFMLCVNLACKGEKNTFIIGILIVTFIIRTQGDLGVLLNLKRPNLEWDNETIPVKQSMSVLFAMLIGFAEILVLIGVSLVLISMLDAEYIMGILFILSALFSLLIRKRLAKKGTKLFNEL